MTRPTALVPLALAALLAACGDHSAVREAEAMPASPSSETSTVETPPPAASADPAQACDAGNGGLTLPAGFCATVFADVEGGPRHIAVAPNGDVFVALGGGR